ncbi:hypothetical protein ACFXHA_45085 [Nocardia sp. NPDC059240]|uniref:hypothetical protein n=1 Tax=Nocardia sp. NPDC059240 TaxID=3346786 RepID=UPI0036AB744E
MKLLTFPSAEPVQGPPPDLVAAAVAAELAKELGWSGHRDFAERARAVVAVLGYEFDILEDPAEDDGEDVPFDPDVVRDYELAAESGAL